MRKYFRYFVSSLWAIVFVLFAFTLETVADELGYSEKIRNIVSKGWKTMDSAGYSSWIFAVFMLLTGATLAVWIEYGLRRWESYKTANKMIRCSLDLNNGSIDFHRKEGLAAGSVFPMRTVSNFQKSDPKNSNHIYTISLIFEEDMDSPQPDFFSSRTVIWRKIDESKKHIMLEFDIMENDAVSIDVIVRPLSWADRGEFQAELYKWSDSHVVAKDKIIPTI